MDEMSPMKSCFTLWTCDPNIYMIGEAAVARAGKTWAKIASFVAF